MVDQLYFDKKIKITKKKNCTGLGCSALERVEIKLFHKSSSWFIYPNKKVIWSLFWIKIRYPCDLWRALICLYNLFSNNNKKRESPTSWLRFCPWIINNLFKNQEHDSSFFRKWNFIYVSPLCHVRHLLLFFAFQILFLTFFFFLVKLLCDRFLEGHVTFYWLCVRAYACVYVHAHARVLTYWERTIENDEPGFFENPTVCIYSCSWFKIMFNVCDGL